MPVIISGCCVSSERTADDGVLGGFDNGIARRCWCGLGSLKRPQKTVVVS